MRSELALVVLSGGQDSTTCLALALQEYGREQVYAITFDYGQRHRAEINAAHRIACLAGIASHYTVIDIHGVLEGTSPLVNPAADVEAYANAASLPGGLEKTFVPMRNQLFFTLAANRAVVIGLEHGRDVDILTGVSQEDYGGYPDCRQAFIDSLNKTIDWSLNDLALPEVVIRAPLMQLDKERTVILSEDIPGARALLAYSHTCYNGSVPPCGTCHACLLREKGYAKAGVSDPLLKRLEAETANDAGFISSMLDTIPKIK